MHPPRRQSATERQGIADRLTDWLLTHCPFSTLAVLTAIVLAPAVGPLPQPALVAVPVVLADVVLNLSRRLLRGPV